MHQDKNQGSVFSVPRGSSGQFWTLLQALEHSNTKRSFGVTQLKSYRQSLKRLLIHIHSRLLSVHLTPNSPKCWQPQLRALKMVDPEVGTVSTRAVPLQQGSGKQYSRWTKPGSEIRVTAEHICSPCASSRPLSNHTTALWNLPFSRSTASGTVIPEAERHVACNKDSRELDFGLLNKALWITNSALWATNMTEWGDKRITKKKISNQYVYAHCTTQHTWLSEVTLHGMLTVLNWKSKLAADYHFQNEVPISW